MSVKKLFLFAIIFTLLPGNMCFSENINLDRIIPNEERIVRGTISSEIPQDVPVNRDGFTVERTGDGLYAITFNPAFPTIPTLVCTYQELPGGSLHPRAQIRSVSPTGAIVVTATVTGQNVGPFEDVLINTGSVTFIAAGPR